MGAGELRAIREAEAQARALERDVGRLCVRAERGSVGAEKRRRGSEHVLEGAAVCAMQTAHAGMGRREGAAVRAVVSCAKGARGAVCGEKETGGGDVAGDALAMLAAIEAAIGGGGAAAADAEIVGAL